MDTQFERMKNVAQGLGLPIPDGSTLLGLHAVVCENLWRRLDVNGFRPGINRPIVDKRRCVVMVITGRQNTMIADIRMEDGGKGSASIIYLARWAIPELAPILDIWIKS